MSPVRQPKQRDTRAVAVAVVTLVVAVVLGIVVIAVLVPKLSENKSVKISLGTDTFDAGGADNLVSSANEAPLLFPDIANGQRDIYLVHAGQDPLTGWLAFDARRPGQPRECTLVWKTDVGDPPAKAFVDPCDGTVVGADGAGLTHYTVKVDDNRHVIIDLKADPAGSTTTTTTRP